MKRPEQWRRYYVWQGRHGVEPSLVIPHPFQTPEAAERVRVKTEQQLNELADPGNPWRVWVENRKDKPNDVAKWNAALLNSPSRDTDPLHRRVPEPDAEGRERPGAGNQPAARAD